MRAPHYVVTMGLTEEERAVVERNPPARDREAFQTSLPLGDEIG